MESSFFLPFLLVVGAAFGSFFGVLIERLPQEQSILGRSHCDYCRKKLKSRDLIPIISYVITGGKTRCCGRRLTLFYPFLEILSGFMFVGSWLYLGNTTVEKLIYLGIVSTLIVIFFADVKYQIIPDSMQVVLLLLAVTLQLLHVSNYINSSLSLIWSGLVVMAPILVLFAVTRGRGMGFGDVKLAFIMGVMLGWAGGLLAVYLGFVAGAVVGSLLIFKGKKKLKSRIAFGPFLIVGIVTVILAHDTLFRLIYRIYGY